MRLISVYRHEKGSDKKMNPVSLFSEEFIDLVETHLPSNEELVKLSPKSVRGL